MVLDFWATWCVPCKTEIPWFIEFQEKDKDRGLAVVGVSLDKKGWKVVRPYMEQMKMNYPVLLGNDSVAALYGGLDELPATYLLDREGKIVSRHVGLAGKRKLESEIQALLR